MTGPRPRPTSCLSRLATRTLGGALLVWVVLLADGILAACAVTALVAAALLIVGGGPVHPRRTVRVGVVGSTACTAALASELEVTGTHRYEVVGRIAACAGEEELADRWTIGTVEELGRLTEEQCIDLVLMSREGPRLAVFDAMSRGWVMPRARLWELAAFYEETFGHIPVAEINTAWFQYILHPRYRPSSPRVKRAIDIVISVTLGLFTAPLMAVAALLIRRDGGPAIFRQQRVGEGGVPFTMYKLRTMTTQTGADTAWSSRDDARVTRVGALLRKTHLDELPQLFNVLRGDMSMVGPRPEQPLFVAQLERTIPFYSRRHQIRPGVTGWAQVRCGYAGSEVGTAWKLCHDLYYLKHRSIALDMKILLRTVVSVLADRQWLEARCVQFVYTPPVVEAAGLDVEGLQGAPGPAPLIVLPSAVTTPEVSAAR